MSMATTAESIRAEAARRGVSVWQVRRDRGETHHGSSDDRLEADLHDRLRQEAADRDVSANWLANRAIQEFLDRLVPADEFRLTR